MGREVIEQGARDRRLADASLVRAHHDYRWLRHGRSPVHATLLHSGSVRIGARQKTTSKSEKRRARFPQVAFTHPGEFLEGGSSACLLAPGGRLWRHCGSAAMRPPGPGVGVVGWRRRARWRQRSSVVALAGAVAGRRSPGALSRSLLAVGGFRFRACLLVLASW